VIGLPSDINHLLLSDRLSTSNRKTWRIFPESSQTRNRKENMMKLNLFDRIVLALATIFLGVIALQPQFTPQIAQAQGASNHLYVEPGIVSLFSPDKTRTTQGKVMIDLATGNVWGFPTATEAPYPIDHVAPQPATSSPMYLGKFDLTGMHRP
jgi:hypothetical protein